MNFVKITDRSNIDVESINYLWDYYPKNRGPQDTISEQILMLKGLHKMIPFNDETKQTLELIVATFTKHMVKKLPNAASNYIFCLVPSHSSGTDNKNGIYMFGRWCNAIRYFFDKDIIERIVEIESLHSGGDRSLEVQLNSLKINKNVKDKKIVVIDDVTTSGNSLIACKTLLQQSGASEVLLFAFGKTVSLY